MQNNRLETHTTHTQMKEQNRYCSCQQLRTMRVSRNKRHPPALPYRNIRAHEEHDERAHALRITARERISSLLVQQTLHALLLCVCICRHHISLLPGATHSFFFYAKRHLQQQKKKVRTSLLFIYTVHSCCCYYGFHCVARNKNKRRHKMNQRGMHAMRGMFLLLLLLPAYIVESARA